jgi:hypothetical protein
MSLLKRNLEALQGWAPLTAAQIAGASVPEGFERVIGSDGSSTYQRIVPDGASGRRVEWLGGTSMPRASAEALTDSLEVGRVNGIGLSIGTGYEWAAFARRLPSSQALYVYEPEAGYARMALECCDLSDWFRSGKVILFTGPLAPASEEMSAFVADHVGFEPPTVLHPLPTMGAERRNALLSAGEAMVRRTVVERQAKVNALAGRVDEAMRNVSEAEIAFLATPRYAQERPIAAANGRAAQVLLVDGHASAGVGAWLAAIAEHRPRKIVSDFFRVQIGCVPEQVAVETWIPPLAGAGYWDRVPDAATFGPNDRVIVHGAWHAERLADCGISTAQVQVRPLERRLGRPRSGEERRHRVALIGDLPSIEPETMGIELPTHLAVFAAVREMIEEDYLTVHVGQAGDILRRALARVGVQSDGGGQGQVTDPALREPMLRIVRDVLIPTVPLLRLVEELMAQGVPLRLIGDWPGVTVPAGDAVVVTPFWEVGRAEKVWSDVAIVAHLSANGMVSPLLMEAVAEGVGVVSPRHATDRYAGSLATLLTPESEYATPAPAQFLARLKGMLRASAR